MAAADISLFFMRFSGKNRKAFAQVFGVKIFGMLSGLGLYAILARLLDVGDMGRYVLIVSMVGFFGLVVQAGLGTAVMRLISAGAPDDTARIIRKALGFVLLGSVLFGLVWWLGVGALVLDIGEIDLAGWGRVALVFWVCFFGLQKIMVEALRGMQKTTLASLFENTIFTGLLLIFVTVVLLFSREITLQDIVLAAVICMGLSVALAALYLQKSTGFIRQHGRKSKIVFWGLAAPVLVTELAVFFNTQADIWIIAAFLLPEDVGIYGVVLRIVLLAMLPTAIITSVVAPQIVRHHKSSEKTQLQQLLRSSAMLAAVPTLLFFGFVAVFGKPLLEFLFGPQFIAGYPVLVVLCAGRAVNVMTGLCGPCLLLCGHQRIMMLSTVFCVVLAIGSAILVADSYGILGVALCFSVAMMLQNILQAVIVSRVLGVSTWLRPFGGAGIVAVRP